MKIGFKYLPGCLSEAELAEISQSLEASNIEFKTHNASGEIYNCLEDLVAPLVLWISSDLAKTHLLAISTSAVYDVVKTTILRIWRKASTKTVFKVTADGPVDQRPVTLDLDLQLNEKVRLKFKLRGNNLSPEQQDKYVDQALRFARKFSEAKPQETQVVIYNENLQEWEACSEGDFLAGLVKKKTGK